MPLADGDRPRLASKIEQYDEDNLRRYDHRRHPRSESPPSRYNRDGRRSRVSPSYTPYSCHHRNPRYEDDIYHANNRSKNEFSDSDGDEELKGLSYSEYRRLKRQKLRKKLKNCIWRVTPSPPRNERDQSEPLDDSEEDDDLIKMNKHESSDEDDGSGSRKRKRGKRSNSDESDEDSSSDSYDDSDDSRERKSSRKKKSRRSRNDTEEDSEDSRSRKRRSRRKRSYSVGASEDNSSLDSSDDSDDSRKRKTSRRRKSRKSKKVDDSESSDHSLSDRRRKHSRKKRSRKSKTDSDEEVSDDSSSDRKKRYSRKKRNRKSSSRKKSSRGRRRRRKSSKPSSGSSGESDKEKDESMSDASLAPKMKKSSKKADTSITSDSEIKDDSKKQETDTKKVELDPEALAFKELLESQKKNKAEETDTMVGPVPLPKAEGHISYGGALRPGEGDAIAQYVQQGKRIPRRGEVGLSADEIQKFESLGYVMSGSRHQRMNAIRIRKENQVYSAEDKRALAMFNYEEKAKREHKVMADLQRLVQRHIGQDTGPAHDPFGKDSGAADA